MCMTEFHKHEAHQSLQTSIYDVRTKKSDLVTNHGDIEKKWKTWKKYSWSLWQNQLAS